MRRTGRGRHPAFRSVDRRRAAIMEALLQAMSEKGFSHTSLTDLARRAGMSPGHLLYYFRDKDAVLTELSKQINDQTLDFMGELADKPPHDQFRDLVGFFFNRRNVPPSFRSVLLQLLGVATHDPELLDRMKRQARRFKTFLKQAYSKSHRPKAMTVDDAATAAAAIWMGLLINSLFDPTLTTPRAGRLMLKLLLLLGGFEGDAPFEPDSPLDHQPLSRRRSRTR